MINGSSDHKIGMMTVGDGDALVDRDNDADDNGNDYDDGYNDDDDDDHDCDNDDDDCDDDDVAMEMIWSSRVVDANHLAAMLIMLTTL